MFLPTTRQDATEKVKLSLVHNRCIVIGPKPRELLHSLTDFYK
jgi:hypothetical protein